MQNAQTFRRTFHLAAAGIVAIGAVNAVRAQTPGSDTIRPAFEVASVKPNNLGNPGARINVQPGGRVTLINLPLREIIRVAYQVPDLQLMGGPDWIRSSRFDIVAKADGEDRKSTRLNSSHSSPSRMPSSA